MTNKNPNLDKVTNDSDISSEQKTAIEKRRNVLKGAIAGAGITAVLPEAWVNPVINTVVVPVHAQTSSITTAPVTSVPVTTVPVTTVPVTSMP